ncbi:hypothetical protein OS493_006742 [Desmophyllum pertusum]|uniref:Tyr recombinase domain-containing protein n=1 Tax=Desmophyllum pertusum TaxID=174260 RepID=A0A9X0D4N1_9CNID|nr:hypothetical protein OS493_006742 [Desmophyllum pertusum]
MQKSNFTLEDKEFTNDHENSEDEHSMHSKAPDLGDEGDEHSMHSKAPDHGDEGGEHPMHSKAPDHGDEGGEHSMHSKAPDRGDEGGEHSMHSKAPDRGDEGGGSDAFATENDLPETAGPAITKTKDLGSESKILGEFTDWLLSPDGEQKDKKTAHQHWSQLKRVISITSGCLASLVDAKVIRDVFLRYATETYCPATIKSYLMSLQHYCSFLLEDKPSGVDYDKDDVTALRVKLKKWSASYKRSGTRRRWEKQEEDLSCLITPEKVNEFDQSQAVRDAIIIIGRLCGAHSIEITQAMYTLVRDYLIAQIMIDNANRAGVVAYMTVEEFKRASMEDDRHVVRVLHHKTVDTHGPSVVVLTAHLYNHLKVFFEEMRSKLPLPDDRLEGKQPMFLSWNGKRLQSSQVTKALGSVFKKAGVEGRVHHTLYRKSAVTQCHDKHKEIASHLADLMSHRESTAEKYYRVFDKNKSSVKASQTLHGMMRNTKSKSPIVREEESEEGVDKFAENKDVQGDSATTSRSPWNEDSIEALRTLFKEEISAQSVSMTCVRDKIESNPVLCLEDPKRVYDKVRAEWRYKGNTDSSMELTKLPEETETVNHRVDRMFASNNENMADNSSSHSTDFVSATDTTVKSKGLFSNSQAKVLVELFPDMVNDGKPISKPVIIKRLSECSKGDLFKDYNVVQVVNRIKYERRQKREREQSRKVGVNKLT